MPKLGCAESSTAVTKESFGRLSRHPGLAQPANSLSPAIAPDFRHAGIGALSCRRLPSLKRTDTLIVTPFKRRLNLSGVASADATPSPTTKQTEDQWPSTFIGCGAGSSKGLGVRVSGAEAITIDSWPVRRSANRSDAASHPVK